MSAKKFFGTIFGFFYGGAGNWFSQPPTLIKKRRGVAWVFVFGLFLASLFWLWVILR